MGLLGLFFCTLLLHLSSFTVEGKPRQSGHYLQVANAMRRWRENENEARAKIDQVPSHCVNFSFITFLFLGDGNQLNVMKTMSSLLSLKKCSWSAIILYSVQDPAELKSEFESYPPFHLSNILFDSRVSYFPTMNLLQTIDQLVMPNITTPWVSFLTSGTELSSRYISHLQSEIGLFPSASSVIFQNPKGPTLSAATASERAIFPAYGYALKQSLFSYRQSQPPQSLSEYISTPMLCAGSTVLSSVMVFRSAPTGLLDFSWTPSSLVTFKYSPPTACSMKDEATSVAPVLSDAVVVLRELPDEAAFLSRFRFPEADSIFFGDNVRGLKEALVRAHKFGCIDPNLKVSCLPPPLLLSSSGYPLTATG
jgi:hypothetical protein